MNKLAKLQYRQNFRIKGLKNPGNLAIWENWLNLRKGLENLAKDQRIFFHRMIGYKKIGQISWKAWETVKETTGKKGASRAPLSQARNFLTLEA